MKFYLCIAVLCLYSFLYADPVVIYSADATPVEKTAVQELTDHLKKILGRDVAAVKEGSAVSGRRIYVGYTKFASEQLGVQKFGAEESLLKGVGDHLIITGGKPRGVLYGVYEFLERFGNVIWLDPDHTVIPYNPALTWQKDLNLRTAPVFRYRGIYINGINISKGREKLRAYMSRNRENIFWQGVFTKEERERWGITPLLGRPSPLNTMHYYSVLWPREGMESARSLNVVGERDYSRSYCGPGQICFSSPLARKKVSEQMIGFIREDRKEFPSNPPPFYNLSINDTQDRCVCKECTSRAKKYNSYAGTVLEFVNAVAEEVGKVYPDVRIQTSAYLFTEKAPDGIRMNKNVINRLSPSPYVGCQTMLPLTSPVNSETLLNLKKWSELGKIHIWNYWVVFGNYPGRNSGVTNIPVLQGNLQLFHKLGSDYVFSECEFPETASFHALRVYLGYQLIRNPYQDMDVLLKRFFTAWYGAAAPAMRKFFDYQNKRQVAELKKDGIDSTERPYLDATFFQFAERCFQEAEKSAGKNALLQQRIAQERISVDIAHLSAPALPADPAVAARLKQNWTESLNRLYGKVWPYGEKSRMDALFAKLNRPVKGAKYPLSAELAARVQYDLCWKDFNAVSELKSFGLKLVNDPDAVGGRAMCMAQPLRSPAKGYHKKDLQISVYSRSSKRNLLRTGITLAEDEKYHLYRIGVSCVELKTLLLLHPSWQIRQDLESYAEKPGEDRFDIWVSIKGTGPAYSPDSKQKNALFIDRILLLTPEEKK